MLGSVEVKRKRVATLPAVQSLPCTLCRFDSRIFKIGSILGFSKKHIDGVFPASGHYGANFKTVWNPDVIG